MSSISGQLSCQGEIGVAFVEGTGPNVGATITPHHLVINRNALFAGGLRPHAYCLPVAKREVHRRRPLSGSPCAGGG